MRLVELADGCPYSGRIDLLNSAASGSYQFSLSVSGDHYMNRLTRIGVAAALTAASALAFSQAGPGGPPNPAKGAIEARQGLFKLIGNQSGPINGMNRPNAPAPDLAVVARNAARLQVLGEMIPEMFTLDTRADTTTKTTAQPAIWTSAADFKAKAEAFVKAAGAVAAAAKTGDVAATKLAAAEIGKTCGGCHDNFRVKP
jgi:cytochrome c556